MKQKISFHSYTDELVPWIFPESCFFPVSLLHRNVRTSQKSAFIAVVLQQQDKVRVGPRRKVTGEKIYEISWEIL